MIIIQKTLEFYRDTRGNIPVVEWLEKLSDENQARIRRRLTQLELGHYGDFKSIGAGIFELRCFFGPGYRIYYGEKGKTVILLLCGGDKSSQKRDIKKAREYWDRYREHS